MIRTAPCYDREDYWGFFDIDLKDLRVLDIGSSCGSFSSARFERARDSVSHAASYVRVDIARSTNPCVCADAHALPFNAESFDLIIANNILEHLRRPEIGVREIRRVLRRDGYVYFTVPFLYPIHESPNDYRRWTAFGLQELFKDFRSLEIKSRGGPFSTVSQLLFLVTRRLDTPIPFGTVVRAALYAPCWLLVQADRWDKSGTFTRVYYGRMRK